MNQKSSPADSYDQGLVFPPNWCLVKLGDIAIINPRSINRELQDDTEISFLPMKNVEEETGKFDLALSRNYHDVRKGYTPFIDNDIIFAKITPCMENGKMAIVSKLKNGIGFGSTEFHVVRLIGDLSRKFFFYYLLQEDFRREARRKMTGTAGQLRVPSKYIEEAKVPLPPINETTRIVSKLEALFTKLDAGIEYLKKTNIMLKQYRQSVLKYAFEGKLTKNWRENYPKTLEPASSLLERMKKNRENTMEIKHKERSKLVNSLPELPDLWSWTTLYDITDLFSGRAFKKAEYTTRGARLLQIANITFGKIIWDEIVHVPMEYQSKYPDLNLKSGDVLMALNRPLLDNKLKIGMLKESDLPAILYQRVGRFDLFDKRMNSYLLLYLQSRFFINILMTSLQGINIPFINKSKLLQMPFPLAPIEEQEVIVEEVERNLSVIDNIQSVVEHNLNYSNKFTSIHIKICVYGQIG